MRSGPWLFAPSQASQISAQPPQIGGGGFAAESAQQSLQFFGEGVQSASSRRTNVRNCQARTRQLTLQ
jgi:hypothetical protein